MKYPHEPGYKENETSREAAEAIAADAPTLRGITLAYIRQHPGLTADQIATALNKSVLTIRPRVSELRRMGLIINLGRGRNRSGHGAHTWIAP